MTTQNRGSSLARRTTLRDRQKAFTQQQLLTAARQEFASRGFSGTTIDHIAQAAGTSRATFYLHFKNKEEVVSQLLIPMRHESQVDVPKRLAALITADGKAAVEEASRDWAQNSLDFFREQTDLVRLYQETTAIMPALEREATTNVRKIARATIGGRGRARAEESQLVQLELALLATFGMAERLLRPWLDGLLSGVSEEQVVDALSEMLRDVLMPALLRSTG